MAPARLLPGTLPKLKLPSWPWRITWLYLGLVLFLPLGAISLRAAGVGPAGFWELATTPEAVATYQLSFGLALLASLINGVFGLVIAWALVRSRFPGQRFLDSLIDLPFALPTAVAGLALAAVYSSENGWLGEPLYRLFGIKVAFSAIGVAVAMVFISLPFVVRTVEPVLRSLEKEQEEASWCLGESRAATSLRVVLPACWPGIVTGLVMTFAHVVGEFGVVLMVGGNIPGVTRTLSVALYDDVQALDHRSAARTATVLVIAALMTLVAVQWLARKTAARGRGR
jgi:sulfate transport system permease protein